MTPSPFAEFAIAIARRGGAHLLTLLPSAASAKEIRFKGPTDLVTRADHEVEALIAGEIARTYPTHGLLAEEGTARPGTEYRWIVDPLDGTTNFAHGLPWFGVSIALEYQGRVMLGVVYHPSLDELCLAERDRGSWVAIRGRPWAPLQVSATEDLGSAVVGTGLAGRGHRAYLRSLPTFLEEAREVRIMGSAAVHLALVAAGRIDAFWEPGLNLWDIAAGALLVEEAGGRVSDLAGRPGPTGDILATNGRLHTRLLALLADRP